LRIIVINDYGVVNGGASQIALSSATVLANRGFDVTFISGISLPKNIENCFPFKFYNFDHFDLLTNPSKLSAAYHGIWDHRCSKKLAAILEEYDPRNTVIHLHTWVKSLTSSIVNEAVKKKFKVVCTLHDYFTVCPNGGFYNYKKGKQCDLFPLSLLCISSNCDSRNYSQKLWRVARQIVQRKFGCIPCGIENFITISDYSESILRKWLPKNKKFYRVYNPIDIEKTFPTDVSLNNVFTFIGRLSPEKGAVLFAAAALRANIKAIFVGSGSEDVSIRDINPFAELRGWQDRDGVISAIRSSRAIVFPSLLHETQGLVVSESAALGVPALVSDNCAAKENILDGETGLLFRSGDVEDLASKLLLLSSDKALSRNLGIKAYSQYWTCPCTLDRHASELIKCYEDILSLSNRATA